MRAQVALILAIALSALAAVGPNAAAAADRRAQPMQFELLREGPAEACGSSCGAWISATGVITRIRRRLSSFEKQHDIRGGMIALDPISGSVRSALCLPHYSATRNDHHDWTTIDFHPSPMA